MKNISMNFYKNLVATCYKKETNISNLSQKVGLSVGAANKWKNGSPPNLNAVAAIADELCVTIDDLVYGEGQHSPRLLKSPLDDEQRRWLMILDRVPKGKRKLYMDFLLAHAVGVEE